MGVAQQVVNGRHLGRMGMRISDTSTGDELQKQSMLGLLCDNAYETTNSCSVLSVSLFFFLSSGDIASVDLNE